MHDQTLLNDFSAWLFETEPTLWAYLRSPEATGAWSEALSRLGIQGAMPEGFEDFGPSTPRPPETVPRYSEQLPRYTIFRLNGNIYAVIQNLGVEVMVQTEPGKSKRDRYLEFHPGKAVVSIRGIATSGRSSDVLATQPITDFEVLTHAESYSYDQRYADYYAAAQAAKPKPVVKARTELPPTYIRNSTGSHVAVQPTLAKFGLYHVTRNEDPDALGKAFRPGFPLNSYTVTHAPTGLAAAPVGLNRGETSPGFNWTKAITYAYVMDREAGDAGINATQGDPASLAGEPVSRMAPAHEKALEAVEASDPEVRKAARKIAGPEPKADKDPNALPDAPSGEKPWLRMKFDAVSPNAPPAEQALRSPTLRVPWEIDHTDKGPYALFKSWPPEAPTAEAINRIVLGADNAPPGVEFLLPYVEHYSKALVAQHVDRQREDNAAAVAAGRTPEPVDEPAAHAMGHKWGWATVRAIVDKDSATLQGVMSGDVPRRWIKAVVGVSIEDLVAALEAQPEAKAREAEREAERQAAQKRQEAGRIQAGARAIRVPYGDGEISGDKYVDDVLLPYADLAVATGAVKTPWTIRYIPSGGSVVLDSLEPGIVKYLQARAAEAGSALVMAKGKTWYVREGQADYTPSDAPVGAIVQFSRGQGQAISERGSSDVVDLRGRVALRVEQSKSDAAMIERMYRSPGDFLRVVVLDTSTPADEAIAERARALPAYPVRRREPWADKLAFKLLWTLDPEVFRAQVNELVAGGRPLRAAIVSVGERLNGEARDALTDPKVVEGLVEFAETHPHLFPLRSAGPPPAALVEFFGSWRHAVADKLHAALQDLPDGWRRTLPKQRRVQGIIAGVLEPAGLIGDLSAVYELVVEMTDAYPDSQPDLGATPRPSMPELDPVVVWSMRPFFGGPPIGAMPQGLGSGTGIVFGDPMHPWTPEVAKLLQPMAPGRAIINAFGAWAALTRLTFSEAPLAKEIESCRDSIARWTVARLQGLDSLGRPALDTDGPGLARVKAAGSGDASTMVRNAILGWGFGATFDQNGGKWSHLVLAMEAKIRANPSLKAATQDPLIYAAAASMILGEDPSSLTFRRTLAHFQQLPEWQAIGRDLWANVRGAWDVLHAAAPTLKPWADLAALAGLTSTTPPEKTTNPLPTPEGEPTDADLRALATEAFDAALANETLTVQQFIERAPQDYREGWDLGDDPSDSSAVAAAALYLNALARGGQIALHRMTRAGSGEPERRLTYLTDRTRPDPRWLAILKAVVYTRFEQAAVAVRKALHAKNMGGTLLTASPLDDTEVWRFDIPRDRVGAARALLAKLTRKADKLGVPPVQWTEGEEFSKSKVDEESGATIVRWYTPFVVRDPEARIGLDGWQFAATIDHGKDDDGKPLNLVLSSPTFGRNLPKHYRTDGPTCDHCKVNRRRNQTFVVQNNAEGYKRVGRACLQDFLGDVTAAHVLGIQAILREIQSSLSDWESEGAEGSSGGGSLGEWAFGVTRVLAEAASVIRQLGWRSRREARQNGTEATADTVWTNLTWHLAKRRGTPPARPTAADEVVAEQAKAWAEAIDPDTDSDYLSNVRVAVGRGLIGTRELGLAVSAVPAWQKEEGKKLLETDKPSEWIGTIGVRFGGAKKGSPLMLQVQILDVSAFSGEFGPASKVKGRTVEGNDVFFYGPVAEGEFQWLRPGAWAFLTGTVTKHTQLQGRKSTTLNKVKLIESTPPDSELVRIAQNYAAAGKPPITAAMISSGSSSGASSGSAMYPEGWTKTVPFSGGKAQVFHDAQGFGVREGAAYLYKGGSWGAVPGDRWSTPDNAERVWTEAFNFGAQAPAAPPKAPEPDPEEPQPMTFLVSNGIREYRVSIDGRPVGGEGLDGESYLLAIREIVSARGERERTGKDRWTLRWHPRFGLHGGAAPQKLTDEDIRASLVALKHPGAFAVVSGEGAQPQGEGPRRVGIPVAREDSGTHGYTHIIHDGQGSRVVAHVPAGAPPPVPTDPGKARLMGALQTLGNLSFVPVGDKPEKLGIPLTAAYHAVPKPIRDFSARTSPVGLTVAMLQGKDPAEHIAPGLVERRDRFLGREPAEPALAPAAVEKLWAPPLPDSDRWSGDFYRHQKVRVRLSIGGVGQMMLHTAALVPGAGPEVHSWSEGLSRIAFVVIESAPGGLPPDDLGAVEGRAKRQGAEALLISMTRHEYGGGLGDRYRRHGGYTVVAMDTGHVVMGRRLYDSVVERLDAGRELAWLPLESLRALVPAAEVNGVSDVARSERGFVTAYERAGGDPAALGTDPHSGQDWRARRNAFVARHRAQAESEGYWVDGAPTRRHLALAMWAWSPEPQRLLAWASKHSEGGVERLYASRRDVPPQLRALTVPQANYWSRVYDAVKARDGDRSKAARIAWYQTRRQVAEHGRVPASVERMAEPLEGPEGLRGRAVELAIQLASQIGVWLDLVGGDVEDFREAEWEVSRWAKEHDLVLLGIGTSRVVFDLQGYAFKVPLSDQGRACNRRESEVWSTAPPEIRQLLMPVLLADPQGAWLLMEQAPLAEGTLAPADRMALLAFGIGDLTEENIAEDGRVLDYGQRAKTTEKLGQSRGTAAEAWLAATDVPPSPR